LNLPTFAAGSSSWVFHAGVFVAALAGSWHCAGMCGPFAAMVVRDGIRLRQQVAYHAGRLATYLALAVALHFVGSSFRSVFHALGIPRWGVIAFTAAVFLWAAMVAFKVPLPSFPGSRRISAALSRRIAAINRASAGSALAPFVVGATTTLLPCLWLYGYLAVAASRPTLAQSLLVMALFWSANIPWLVASHSILGFLHRNLTGWSRPIGAAFLALVMTFAAWHALPRADLVDVSPGKKTRKSCCSTPKHHASPETESPSAH
jgi:sulfite exporter TauE/SafE